MPATVTTACTPTSVPAPTRRVDRPAPPSAADRRQVDTYNRSSDRPTLTDAQLDEDLALLDKAGGRQSQFDMVKVLMTKVQTKQQVDKVGDKAIAYAQWYRARSEDGWAMAYDDLNAELRTTQMRRLLGNQGNASDEALDTAIEELEHFDRAYGKQVDALGVIADAVKSRPQLMKVASRADKLAAWLVQTNLTDQATSLKDRILKRVMDTP